MRRRTKIIVGMALLVAVCLAARVSFSPLANFSHRISDADRAVVTFTLNDPPPVSVTITGQVLRTVVGMISSAHRDRKNYSCSSVANVKFFKNSEMLGQMTACIQLMWIGPRQYRDDTGMLDKLIVTPLLDAKRVWESQPQSQIK